MSAPDLIASYYDDKTRRILARYGPGPDVHYHAGIVDEGAFANSALQSRRAIRTAVVSAQRRLVDRVGRALQRRGSRRLLDAGCGLGGPAIRLLSTGAVQHVDGITLSTLHPPVASALAAQAKVDARARFSTADVHHMDGPPRRYDAALALESSCYFDRPRAFAALGRALKPGGALLIVDCFLHDPATRAAFDRYWRTSIGSVDEYVSDAASCGLSLHEEHALNAQTHRFWDLTLATVERDLREAVTDDERSRLVASRAAHGQLRSWFASGAIAYRWLTFIKEQP